MISYWREYAKPIIASVIVQYPLSGKEQRRALRDAYPFGERRYHPYKIWLDEIARQTGRKPPLYGRSRVPLQEEGQISLFEEERYDHAGVYRGGI